MFFMKLGEVLNVPKLLHWVHVSTNSLVKIDGNLKEVYLKIFV